MSVLDPGGFFKDYDLHKVATLSTGIEELGYLPFTRENRKFRLENQMVRAIPFGKP